VQVNKHQAVLAAKSWQSILLADVLYLHCCTQASLRAPAPKQSLPAMKHAFAEATASVLFYV
jgi:hypothetical protein